MRLWASLRSRPEQVARPRRFSVPHCPYLVMPTSCVLGLAFCVPCLVLVRVPRWLSASPSLLSVVPLHLALSQSYMCAFFVYGRVMLPCALFYVSVCSFCFCVTVLCLCISLSLSFAISYIICLVLCMFRVFSLYMPLPLYCSCFQDRALHLSLYACRCLPLPVSLCNVYVVLFVSLCVSGSVSVWIDCSLYFAVY